jgi:hypothetical protein
MADPATLPSLADWNDAKLANAVKLSAYTPSGIKCPLSDSELLDIPGTTSQAKIGELVLFTIQVICPDDGFKGERFL